MAYTIDIVDTVINTIGKFATLNNHQLAGHVANLDFWTRQVKHALEAVDGYPSRQRALEEGQKKYIAAHDARQFDVSVLERPEEDLIEHGYIYFNKPAQPDRHHIKSSELKEKRHKLTDCFYRFIRRCHQEKVLDAQAARQSLSVCGIGVEPGDFPRD